MPDTETGLIYMRARYYDPVIGRFLSEDFKESGDNWYIYCTDNPTNRVDSTGAIDEWIFDALWDILRPFRVETFGIPDGFLAKATASVAYDVLMRVSRELLRRANVDRMTTGDLFAWGEERDAAGDEDGAAFFYTKGRMSLEQSVEEMFAAEEVEEIAAYFQNDAAANGDSIVELEMIDD